MQIYDWVLSLTLFPLPIPPNSSLFTLFWTASRLNPFARRQAFIAALMIFAHVDDDDDNSNVDESEVDSASPATLIRLAETFARVEEEYQEEEDQEEEDEAKDKINDNGDMTSVLSKADRSDKVVDRNDSSKNWTCDGQ